MKFYQRHDEDLQINLTPLIDVVFLLLIFFMVSTTFNRESQLQIRLPEASVEQKIAEDTPILEIQISRGKEYAIRGPADDAPKPLINSDEETLYRAMQEAVAGANNPVVVIRADRDTPHSAVVQAMDVARRLELLRITFATIDTP
ncbi:MAG: biopolymer transporter ExbD [marine bacterium B5-7]|nr:MAG: biopolymer transporter ExbD [marine bacterium B5-7]